MDVFDILFYLLPLFVYYVYVRYVDSYWRSLYWIWDNGSDETSGTGTSRIAIDTNDISFPPNFIWGVATSAHQVEGQCTNCQWTDWESKKDENGKHRIKRGQKAGKSADFWNSYEEDINKCKTLGVNGFRLSMEWSKIEYLEGKYNDEVLHHYHHVIDCLLKKNITPMVTLHHFTHPLWFEALGAFEKKENIGKFVNFCEFLFSEFSSKVTLWCTFNEPFFFVFGGWMNGNFPPGKRDNALAGVVLVNLLEAHVQVYHKLKSLPNGENCSIGITKDIYQFDPWNPVNPLDIGASKYLNSLFMDNILEFFTKGSLTFRPIGVPPIIHHNPKAMAANDFIGLNYYSHSFVKFKLSLPNPIELCLPPQGVIMTDQSNAAIYPEGLYRAIMSLSQLKIPIYVTENGIADANDDRRHLFLRRYIYAMSRAIAEGANVKGYFYWSLVDCFEWNKGFDLKFGFFHVDFHTQKRTLRDGAKYYSQVIQKFKGRRKESHWSENDKTGQEKEKQKEKDSDHWIEEEKEKGKEKEKYEDGIYYSQTHSPLSTSYSLPSLPIHRSDDQQNGNSLSSALSTASPSSSPKSQTQSQSQSQSRSSSSSSLVHRSNSILSTINNNYYIVPNDNAIKSFASNEEGGTGSGIAISTHIHSEEVKEDKKTQ